MVKLRLAVCEKGRVIESAVLAWSKECRQMIVPKRRPDREKEGESLWVIVPERRRAFGAHVNKMLEKFNAQDLRNHIEEELYGFFALVGMGHRWVNDKKVHWCLVLGDRELAPGDAV